jgi:hypothetical protein
MVTNELAFSSEEFRKGVEWLLGAVKKARSLNENPMDRIEAYYLLNKLQLISQQDIFHELNNRNLWVDEGNFELTRDDPHTLWFINKIGLSEIIDYKETLDDLIRMQSIEGFFDTNEYRHTGALRVLSATKSKTEHLDNAIKFWIDHWEIDSPSTIAVGILALSEIDYMQYKAEIEKQIQFLEKNQNENGSWGYRFSITEPDIKNSVPDTAYTVWAIARCSGPDDTSVKKGINWLKAIQKGNGSWDNHIAYTAKCLIALLSAGEGPKTSKEVMTFELEKYQQVLSNQRPIFVHTSPLYQGRLHVKKIEKCIGEMLGRAKKEIRITSPFIDMFYEELINLKEKTPELSIKLITRPKREIEGIRGKIAQNVVDLLGIATKDNVLQSAILHSRVIIIDDTEVLVSSSDLTRDQLYDEFNAGIWTSEREAVQEAIKFFDNLFEMERNSKISK